MVILFLTIESNSFFKIQIKISPESQNDSYAQLYGLRLLWLQILNCRWKEEMTAQPTSNFFFLIKKYLIFYTKFSCDERLREALGGNIKYKKLNTWSPLRKSTKYFKKYISQKTSSILVGNCRAHQKVGWHSRTVLCLHLPGYYTDLIKEC